MCWKKSPYQPKNERFIGSVDHRPTYRTGCIVTECKICRYRFHKEIRDKTVIITLVETKTEKEVGYMRFSDNPDYIELEYIVANPTGQGFGSKLMRVIKAIAKAQNKPIYLDAFNYAISFFVKHQFMVIEEKQTKYSELVRMGWQK